MSLILFLDFDGVTHPDVQMPGRCWAYFQSLPLIESVLRKHSSVEIVVTSTWRTGLSLDELRLFFADDMRARVVGSTPVLDRFNRDALRDMHAPHLSEAYRQAEIEAWLHVNRPMGADWLAIDDHHGWFDPGCTRLLITHPRMGFTEVDAQELDERLEALLKAAADVQPGPLTPGQLKTLYPYQFSGPGVPWMSFARGWMLAIENMCHEVDVLLRGRFDRYSFEWADFKEKFGIGRFQYRLVVLAEPDGDGPDSTESTHIKKALREIKHRAEMRTKSLCMVCGQPGALVDAPWMLTLCSEHEAAHQRKERLNAWLADDGSELKLP